MIIEEEKQITEIRRNSDLKLALNRLLFKQSKLKRNLLLSFSPQNDISSGIKMMEPAIKNFQKTNPNDIYFIQKLSYLVKDKANDLVEMQDRENLNQDIAKMYATKLRENMTDIVEDLIKINSESHKPLLLEARAYLVLWIFFEYIIVYGNDFDHILTIRNLFYNYIFEVDVENFELFKRKKLEDYVDDFSLDSQLQKLKFFLRLCDFKECHGILDCLNRSITYDEKSFPGVHYEMGNIFERLSSIALSYLKILENAGHGYDESYRAELLKNIENDAENIIKIFKLIEEVTNKSSVNDGVKKYIRSFLKEIKLILDVFTGEITGIHQITENYKDWILMNIYYRFNKIDFLEVLQGSLKNYENHDNLLDMQIISIVTNDPFGSYQSLKNLIPKWLEFHFMDILYDLDELPNDPAYGDLLEGMSIRNYDYVDFLNYLMVYDVDFYNFINYASLYDSSSNSGHYLMYVEKITIKNVIMEFKKYEEGQVDELSLKEFLQNVLNELDRMNNALFIINSICKICFDKFIELKNYHNAVYFYSFKEIQKTPNACLLRENLFDKLFHVILLSREFPEEMKKLGESNLASQLKDEKLEYLNRLINFLDIINDTEKLRFPFDVMIHIKDFFNYCFVEEKCPKLMWLWTLNLFRLKHKETIEVFKEIKYENYKFAFDNHCKNETKIKTEMRKFHIVNNILFEKKENFENYLEREFYSLTQFLFENQIICYTR